jgi:hypothetical protein
MSNVEPLRKRDDVYNNHQRAMTELALAYLTWMGPDGDKYAQFEDWRNAAANFIEAHNRFEHWLEYHREHPPETNTGI